MIPKTLIYEESLVSSYQPTAQRVINELWLNHEITEPCSVEIKIIRDRYQDPKTELELIDYRFTCEW